jgi:hypothetical protein
MVKTLTPLTGTSPGSSRTWFDDHAGVWVEHGLVSSEQVDAIREFERARAPEPARLSIVAELAV